MQSLHSLTQLALDIRQRRTTPSAAVADCLERIARHDAQVLAWVALDAEGARQTAAQYTAQAAAGSLRGPLHGVPMAIKDIIDVKGMPTRGGSALTSAAPAAADATVVARLRAAGAIILGKTATTEFACFDPCATHNPWNLAHTPGGSSSGSAAALALGMCAGALGSQTGGSITRPASYCGVAGLKPTFGRVSRAGVLAVSFHLDHVGPMARTVADCRLLLGLIAGDDPRDPAVAPLAALLTSPSPERPRLGIVRRYFFDSADAEVADLTEQALRTLAGQGADLVNLDLPEGFDKVHAMHRRIMAVEAADFHRQTFGAPRAGYGPNLAGLLEEGFGTSMADYQAALRQQTGFANAVNRLLEGIDALVTPATPSAAPQGLGSTGDPRFNSPWSYAGVPTVSFPFTLTGAGLPIALQLVGPAWSEERLTAAAMWCEEKLPFSAEPALAGA